MDLPVPVVVPLLVLLFFSRLLVVVLLMVWVCVHSKYHGVLRFHKKEVMAFLRSSLVMSLATIINWKIFSLQIHQLHSAKVSSKNNCSNAQHSSQIKVTQGY
jgi:hypothetical protein